MATYQYLRLEMKATVSENPDFSEPALVYEPDVQQDTRQYMVFDLAQRMRVPPVAAMSLDFSPKYQYLYRMAIRNYDTSIGIVLTWVDADSATGCQMLIDANAFVVLTGVDPSQPVTLMSNGATPVMADMFTAGDPP